MVDEATLKKVWKVQTDILDEIVKICEKHGLRYYLIYGTLIGAVRHSGFIPWDDDLDIMMPRNDYQAFLKAALEELPAEYFLQYDKTEEGYWLNFAKIRKNNTLFEEPSAPLMGEKLHKGIFVDIFPIDSVCNPHSRMLHVRAVFAKAINEVRYYKKGMLGKDVLNYKKLDAILKLFSQRALGKWYDLLVINHRDADSEFYVDLFANRSYKKSIYPKSCFGDGKKMKFMDKEYNVPEQYDVLLTREYGDYMKLPAPEDRVCHDTSRILFDVKNGR